MTQTLTLPKWYDLHAHFRQGDLLKSMVEQHIRMGCAGALGMPNTKPPLSRVLMEEETPQAWSIKRYLNDFRQAWPKAYDLIVPLYLTDDASIQMIEQGKKSGLLRACKYYPPHGTTNSEHGAAFSTYIDKGVFASMEANDVVLCVHGESHGLEGEAYFGRHSNAEESFYRNEMPELIKKFPRLKIVCEHITTKVAADFVQQNSAHVVATVTPQHLLYTVGHLLHGCKYHLFCLPVVKYQEDVDALLQAVTAHNNSKFFAGTDSAPHTVKATPCGCAGGCFTGGIAPQLYAEAFEKGGVDMSKVDGQEAFKNFLCLNGPAFYGLKIPHETFSLSKQPQEIGLVVTPAGTLTPLPIGMQTQPMDKATLSWSVLVS